MHAIFLSLVIASAIGAAVWVVLIQMTERADAKAAIDRLGTAEIADERAAVLATNRRERLLVPFIAGLADGGHRLTPAGYRDKMARRLRVAGRSSAEDLDRFLAIRVLTLAAAPVVGLVVLSVIGRTKLGFAAAIVLAFCLVALPGSRVTRAAEARQKEAARSLPDVLDLLVISIEAGLGFEQALDRTITAVPGALSDEFSRLLGEVRAGAPRADALRDLADRLDVDDVRRFVLAVLQADKFGVSIGRMLRNQADEVRVTRRQKAQERAQKAPVKMLVPMVFCIFPAIFVVILGPAMLNIMHNFK
ncbi:MAG: type II secretion system F family protein [Actinobacteria bacterium]|nr:type II secretion system F family protein [Actinomycetota bacterium]